VGVDMTGRNSCQAHPHTPWNRPPEDLVHVGAPSPRPTRPIVDHSLEHGQGTLRVNSNGDQPSVFLTRLLTSDSTGRPDKTSRTSPIACSRPGRSGRARCFCI
jgi:hypothetical protein